MITITGKSDRRPVENCIALRLSAFTTEAKAPQTASATSEALVKINLVEAGGCIEKNSSVCKEQPL